jgi:hypothetical protein
MEIMLLKKREARGKKKSIKDARSSRMCTRSSKFPARRKLQEAVKIEVRRMRWPLAGYTASPLKRQGPSLLIGLSSFSERFACSGYK